MQGWAKRAKAIWGNKCHIVESEHSMDVKDKDGECLVSARRNGFGQMADAQSETKAKYPLNALTDPAWHPSIHEEGANWDGGYYGKGSGKERKLLYKMDKRGNHMSVEDSIEDAKDAE